MHLLAEKHMHGDIGSLIGGSTVCIFPSRKEEPLVDMFVIEMLVVLVHSLKMAHRDEKSLGM